MKWRLIFFTAFLSLPLSAFVCADDAGVSKPLPPLTADEPAMDAAREKKIRGLIVQLGDSAWAKREEASRALEEYGESALPFLKEALAVDDAEIRARSEVLIKTASPSVEFSDSTIVTTAGGLQLSGNFFISGGNLVIRGGTAPGITIETTGRFTFKGRKFKIVRSYDGKTASLSMEITESVVERENVRTIAAASEEEFQRKEPELFKIYQKRVPDLSERQSKLRGQHSQTFRIP